MPSHSRVQMHMQSIGIYRRNRVGLTRLIIGEMQMNRNRAEGSAVCVALSSHHTRYSEMAIKTNIILLPMYYV